MANELIDLIRKGYMEDLARSKRNVGFSGVEGEMINAQADQGNSLRNVITNESLGRTPQNYMTSNRTGQTVDLGQSGRNIMLNGRSAVQSPDGNIQVSTDTGNVFTSVAEQNYLREQQRRAAELADLPRRKALAEIAEKEAQANKLNYESSSAGTKGTFNADLGGYVYQPDAANPQGKFVALSGMPTGGGAKSTEGERKAGSLLMRLEGSRRQLNQALTEKPSADKPELLATAFRSVGLESAANATTNAERQRIDSAQEDLLDAALTLGTGAAYTKEQLQGYKKAYFPQIGDSQSNIADKAARLKTIVDAAHLAAGNQSQKVRDYYEKLDASGGKASNVTQEDISHTAKKYGISEEEVKRRLGL